MAFTDEDLARFKADLYAKSDWAAFEFEYCERPELKDLIARLEAAEKVIKQQSYSDTRTYKAWRKAKGE